MVGNARGGNRYLVPTTLDSNPTGVNKKVVTRSEEL